MKCSTRGGLIHSHSVSHQTLCIFAGPDFSSKMPFFFCFCHINLLRQDSRVNPLVRLSPTALFTSHSMNSSGISFPALYLALCTGCFGCFLFFVYRSGWPTRSARLEAPQGCLSSFWAEYSIYIRSSTNICWWECQFCKHLDTILKSHFATTGICLEPISYLVLMFSESLSYRNPIKPLGRIKHNPLYPKFKDRLGEVSS